MDSTTDKKTSLLEESEGGKNCRVRQQHNSWAVLCVLLVTLVAVLGVAFAGGYFLGKDRGDTESKNSDSSSTQSYQHKAYNVYYDGATQVIPSFRGSLPVQEFIQPRAVLVDGKLLSAPGNPLLTPKGTSQIFIYQYLDEVSLIVTATGQNYGEKVDNPSLVGEGQYTLTTTGLNGDLIQLTDGYHQLYDRVPIPDSLSVNLQWGNVGSHGFIFVLTDPSSLNATVHFSALSGAQQPLNIRGCHESDTDISSSSLSLRITPYNGKVSFQNSPDSQSETPIPADSQSSNLQLVRLNSNSRRRRSMTTRTPPGLGFILSDPNTKEVLHRIELRREERHGGRNGSLCWSVQNHVDRVEASFCALFYEALYDGLNNEPSEDGMHSMLINTHFRDMSDGGDSTNTWKHVAVLVYDSNPNSIIDRLMNRNARSIDSSNNRVLSDIGNAVEDGAEEEWDRVATGAESTYNALADEANAMRHGHVEWNCGFSQSLKEGGNCVERGVRCGSDISGEGPSFGLDTVMTVYHCGRAIHDCAGFISDCF